MFALFCHLFGISMLAVSIYIQSFC